MVNVLDVPVQENMFFEGSCNVSSTSFDSAVFTMDPKDKYLPPGIRSATITSAVHARNTCLPATVKPMVRVPLHGSTEPELAPQTSKTTASLRTLENQHSLLSVFHRMRQTRSADSNTRSSLVWPRKIFSRAGHAAKQDSPHFIQELLPDRAPSLPSTGIGDGFEMPIQLPSTAGNTDRALTALLVNSTVPKGNIRPLKQLLSDDHSQLALPDEREQGLEGGHATSSVRNSETSFLSSYYTPLEQLKDTSSYFALTPADGKDDRALSDQFSQLDLAPDAEKIIPNFTKMSFDEEATMPNAIPSAETPGSLEPNFHSPNYGYAESLASYATSANFSPCLASNMTHSGPMSPYHLSQPETPVMSDFGDEFLPPLRDSETLAQMGRRTSSDLDLLLARPSSGAAPPHLRGGDTPNSHAKSGGFQGYSLPNHDHASVLTIRKLPSTTFKKIDSAVPCTRHGSKQDLVHAWNDGSEHRMTALGALVDDLGYLGRVII